MPQLFLRVLSEAVELPDEEGFRLDVQWLIKESDGSVRAAGETDYRGLAELVDPEVDWLRDPDHVVVFVPSRFVLMIGCEVPGRSAAQIKRALPFAAEEYVASDIETMHIAHGAIKPGQAVQCDIVAHEVLAGWRACFASVGLNPGAFITDAHVLPRTSGVVSLLFEEEGALVASLDQVAMMDRDNLVLAINSLSPERVVSINGALTDIERGQLDNNPEVEPIAVSKHGLLDYLADSFVPGGQTNLLQGPYTVQRPRSAQNTRWRGVAALAAAWVLLAFVGMLVQGWWASSEAERLESEGFAFYKRVFPRESQPVSIDQLRRRMAAKLGQKVDPSDQSAFVGLLAQFSNVIDSSAEVLSLNFAGQRQELTIEVMVASYDALEAVKDQLASTGVGLEVASAEKEGSAVRSRLRVRYAQ